MKLPFNLKKYSKKKVYGKDQFILIILGISLTISGILFFLSFLCLIGVAEVAGNILTGMDLLVFGLLSSIGPIGFYNHIKAKRKKDIADQLPDFLREISSSTSSGMTVFDAIISASKGDYGRLTPELQKVAAQLSWGIPVDEALTNFAKRVNTPSVKRIVVTINKALEIGGNTSSIFDAAAKEIEQVKLVENQRRSDMSMYSIVVFISYFVFLAVILIINQTIFKEMIKMQTEIQTSGASAVGGFTIAEIDPVGLKNTFFSFVLVQSVGGGLLGGFMMDGKLSSGVRFAFILVIISFFVFKFMF